MFYRIRDGLKFCNTGEEFIFLDAGAGRYFSLPHPTHGAFATLIGERGPLSPEVSRDLRVLIDRGYLIADERRFGVGRRAVAAIGRIAAEQFAAPHLVAPGDRKSTRLN